MGYLDALKAGRVFSAGQTLVATGLLGAQFALFNPIGRNRILYLFQADFSVSAAMEIDWFTLSADPALAAGNAIASANPPAVASGALFEAAVAARPAQLAQFGAAQTAAGGPIPTALDKPLRLAAGFGFLLSSPAVPGSVSLTLGWIEVGPDSDYE